MRRWQPTDRACWTVATTGPGADSRYGTASAVVLPERGAMKATTVSSHDAYRVGPRPAGSCSSPSTSPMSPGASRAAAASETGGAGPRPRGRGQPSAHGSAGCRPAPRPGRRAGEYGRRPPATPPHCHRGLPAASTAAAAATAGVGVWGQALPVRPCRTSTDKLDPERLRCAAAEPASDPCRGPDQPAQRDQPPAAQQHRPGARCVACGERRARPDRAAHDRFPAACRRIAWSVSYK